MQGQGGGVFVGDALLSALEDPFAPEEQLHFSLFNSFLTMISILLHSPKLVLYTLYLLTFSSFCL